LVSESEIDSVIFSAIKPRWQKVAMVLVKSLNRCKKHGLPISCDVLAARIQELAETGRLEGAGDLRKWRRSEVRLKC